MAQDRPEVGTAQASSMRERAAETAQQAGEQAKSMAEQARERAKEHTQTVLDQQKSAAADQIGGLASALHQTADSLQQQNYGFVAQYTERAARSLEDMAESLRARDINELIGQCEQLARRQPALFVGSSVALGFAFARFFKSSAEQVYSAGDYGSNYSSAYDRESGYGAAGQTSPRSTADMASAAGLGAATGAAPSPTAPAAASRSGAQSSGAQSSGAQSGGTAAALGGGYGAPPGSAGGAGGQSRPTEKPDTGGAGVLADPAESPTPGPRPAGYAGATPSGETRNDQTKKKP